MFISLLRSSCVIRTKPLRQKKLSEEKDSEPKVIFDIYVMLNIYRENFSLDRSFGSEQVSIVHVVYIKIRFLVMMFKIRI